MSRRVFIIAAICLSLLAFLSISRSFQFTFFDPIGALDLHSYWYAGHFLRRGIDPWHAYLTGMQVGDSISYLGGIFELNISTGTQLNRVPANTAPIVLILSLLAFFPWLQAKSIWYVFNVGLAILIPQLTFKLLPGRLSLQWRLLISLGFLSFKSTRAAIGNGQTTLLVFSLMLLAILLWEKSDLTAGVALGIALSKYSLALPVIIFAVYKRKWRVAAVAMLTQIVGLLVVWSLTGSDPLSVIKAYYAIAAEHAVMPGIHLAWLFEQGSWTARWTPLLLTCGLAVMLFPIVSPGIPQSVLEADIHSAELDIQDMHVLVALLLWTLLVAYHRPYDGLLTVLFVTVIVYGFQQGAYIELGELTRKSIVALSFFCIAMLILPYDNISRFLPTTFAPIIIRSIGQTVTLSILFLLIATVLLLRSLQPPSEPILHWK